MRPAGGGHRRRGGDLIGIVARRRRARTRAGATYESIGALALIAEIWYA